MAARTRQSQLPRRLSLEHLALTLAFFVLLLAGGPAHAASPYFTLSTNKTFAPGDKPQIHLYTRNEQELEFRIYRVRDEEKFLANLSDLHSFGTADAHASFGPDEQIDEKSWLERFHDWKANLWWNVRLFFKGQFSDKTRDAILYKQASLARRSRIVGVAQFAQIPLLNDKQLVARWRQEVPPTFVSNNQILPIDPLGAGMYLIEATDGTLKAYTLLFVSQTALVTHSANGELLAFVVDRKTGVPIPGAQVSLALGKQTPTHMKTGADGVAMFTAPAKAAKAAAQQAAETDDDSSANKMWVMARTGNDVALVAPWYTVMESNTEDRTVGYVYTDRPVYRPGHTVYFKAILREGVKNHLELLKVTQAHVKITDGEQKTVYEKDLAISPMGTLSGDLVLDPTASLSDYSIEISGKDSTGSDRTYGNGSFKVEDYRKPEYQVRVSAAKPRVLQGGSDTVTIDGRYFFGEPVANAKVKYRVYQSAHYWWGDPDNDDDSDLDTPSDDDSSNANTYDGDQNSEKTGKLNADGKLVVQIPTSFDEKKHEDQDYVVEGAVTDDAGREISSKYRFLASYGSFRVHVEAVNYFIDKGKPASFKITAIDYDNKPVQTAVHLHLYQRKSADTSETAAGDADATTGPDGTVMMTLPTSSSVSGSINARVTAVTPEQRTVQDTGWLWVNGDSRDASWYGGNEQQAKILTDKKIYAPGDIAHITLVSQVEGIHALVTATGYTMEFRKVLTSDGKTASFDLPITSDSQPNLTVDAVFLKDEIVYQAQKSLKVPPAQQQLQITVTPAADTFQPGQSAVYDVLARDAKGAPVSAELSFGVVDEAIYSLYPDSSGDILKQLYPNRYVYANLENSLEYYFTGEAGQRSPLLAERRSRYRPQLAQVKPGNDVVQPRIRKAFPDTAFWNPSVHTDATGHARVTLNFPDSLTTWRATVRAITMDSKAGSSINRVIVRKNIIVRMGQPRFLRKGDLVTVPVIVHNYLTETKQITLSLEATGVGIVNGAAQQVTVPARGESVVNYQLRATTIGTAKLTAKALSTQESDALEISLPVHPSGVAQVTAGSGVLIGSSDRSTQMTFPAGTDPAAHSLSVQVSPSIAGSMFSALDYLTAFPYGCTEQTMSSFLPNIIVAQAMQQLHLPGKVDQAQLNAKIEAGLARLADYQHEDGGWGWWKEDKSQIFMTAYVVSGMAQAKKAGYGRSFSDYAGIQFLNKTLAEHPRMLPELRAYVVYALAESASDGKERPDPKQLDILYSRRNDLSAQALAYTGLAMLDGNSQASSGSHVQEIANLLERKAQVSGDFASWTASRNDLLDIDYDATAESTAFVLKFLAHADPQSPLLPKAAEWLVANRHGGYFWSSTQQTAFVLYGLTDYLLVSHELNADSDVEVFINGVSAGKRHFSRDDALQGSSLSLQLDEAHLNPQQNDVRVVSRGSGRAYWSTQINYFSTAKTSYQQGSMALNIARDYFLLVPQQPTTGSNAGKIVYTLQPLHGPVSQGDVLAVHLGVTGSPQKYLLIEDPIPAGTEFLANTDGYNILQRPDGWDWWYTRQEFHDDHAAIFAGTFEGRHDSFYLLKVINPGSYEISPARVAPMYQPGVQATTDELHLDVKEVGK